MREHERYPALRAGHRHPEAFCLMGYQSDDGERFEILWNSRDGVTPFVIWSEDGREMRHVNWHLDRYTPDFTPFPGQRIFVTMSIERATELARERVRRYWDDPEFPLSARFASQDEAIGALARDYWRDGTAPTVATVRADGTW